MKNAQRIVFAHALAHLHAERHKHVRRDEREFLDDDKFATINSSLAKRVRLLTYIDTLTPSRPHSHTAHVHKHKLTQHTLILYTPRYYIPVGTTVDCCG